MSSPGDRATPSDPAREDSTAQSDAARYRAALSDLGELQEFGLDGLDRLRIPVTSCSLVVDGVMQHAGNGYGLTRAAAERSGLGELAEGTLSALGVARLRTGAVRASRREMVSGQGADRVADPRTLCLPVGSDHTEDQPLTWVPTTRVPTGETVWVPLELVASETGELDGDAAGTSPLLTPITNGLGAGFDADRSLLHGLGELLQRHTNVTRFRALDHLSPEIEPVTLPAAVADLVDRMASLGVEVVLKHAGTELGVVSTYAMGVDADPPQPVVVTACGEAADPDPVRSLTKAVLEYANSRARKAFCFGDPDRARTVAPAPYWSALPETPGADRELTAMRAWAAMSTAELAALTAPDRSQRVRLDQVLPTGPGAGLPGSDLAGSVTARSGVAGTGVPGSRPPRAVGPADQVRSDVAGQLARLLTDLAGSEVPHDVLTVRTEHHGVVVSKTVVTGLEAETLSHGRLGEVGARRLLDTDLDLVRRQDAAAGHHTARVVLTPGAEERLGGPVWWSPTVADRVLGTRYPLYREPPRHSVVVV